MATKDFERLCGLTAKEIDRDKVTNPVLSGILDRITYVGKDGGFMFWGSKDHTDYSEGNRFSDHTEHADYKTHADNNSGHSDHSDHSDNY